MDALDLKQVRLDEGRLGRSDSKSNTLPTYHTTDNLPLVASLLAPLIAGHSFFPFKSRQDFKVCRDSV